MTRLYAYIMNPGRTIQLFSHQKDWRLWWILIAVNALISMIKVSSLGVVSLLSHAVLGVFAIILAAIIFDSTVQLFGKQSQLAAVIYWFGFASTILWLSPSAIIIQQSFYSMGSILMFILKIIFFNYVWISLKKIYGLSKWQLMGLFFIPTIGVVIFVISMSVYIAQLAVAFK